MPEAMPPRGRGWAEKLVAGADASTIQRGEHQGNKRTMRMLHCGWEFSSRPRGVLERSHILGSRRGLIRSRKLLYGIEKTGIGHDYAHPFDLPRYLGLFGVGDQ